MADVLMWMKAAEVQADIVRIRSTVWLEEDMGNSDLEEESN